MFDALKIDIDTEHQLAICRPEGLLDRKLARQLMLFLMAYEESQLESLNRLIDLTAIDQVWLTSQQVFDLSGARRAAAANLSRFRTAIIAPEPLAFGTARMYETLMHGSNIEVGVFWDPASAAAWLGVPENVVHASSKRSSGKHGHKTSTATRIPSSTPTPMAGRKQS